MSSSCRALTSVRAGIIEFGVAVVVLSVALTAQQQKDRKLDKDQKDEARALAQLLDDAQAGREPASDVPIGIASFTYFKAANGMTYVPVTMTIDTAKLTSSAVSVAMRVVRKDAAGAPSQQAGPSAAGSSPAPPVYQDLYFVDVKSQAGKPGRLTRAFQAAGGDYEVFVAVKERTPGDKKHPKMGVYSETLSFPDLSIPGDLALSSTVWLARADELKAPLDADQQRERPYALGGIEIVPADGTKFANTGQLRLFFQIYNYTMVEGNKPDVLVEYSFYRKQDGAEQFFNRTDPDPLNAAHVSPVFDGTKHLLSGGFNIEGKYFPVGDYRVEIKVTDKPSGKSLTRNVEFSVV